MGKVGPKKAFRRNRLQRKEEKKQKQLKKVRTKLSSPLNSVRESLGRQKGGKIGGTEDLSVALPSQSPDDPPCGPHKNESWPRAYSQGSPESHLPIVHHLGGHQMGIGGKLRENIEKIRGKEQGMN